MSLICHLETTQGSWRDLPPRLCTLHVASIDAAQQKGGMQGISRAAPDSTLPKPLQLARSGQRESCSPCVYPLHCSLHPSHCLQHALPGHLQQEVSHFGLAVICDNAHVPSTSIVITVLLYSGTGMGTQTMKLDTHPIRRPLWKSTDLQCPEGQRSWSG